MEQTQAALKEVLGHLEVQSAVSQNLFQCSVLQLFFLHIRFAFVVPVSLCFNVKLCLLQPVHPCTGLSSQAPYL